MSLNRKRTAGERQPDPSSNGEVRPDFHFGENGSVVLICADPDIASEMRKVRLPAVCNVEEIGHVKPAVERRAAIAVHWNHDSAIAAQQAASHVERECHAERVGVLDLAKMGFDGPAESFVSWWTEALRSERYANGKDFLGQCDLRAEWRRDPTGPIDRPAIEISTRRHEALDQTLKAIASDPDLYGRAESLGIVIAEEGETAKLSGGVELRHAQGALRFIPLATSVLGCRLPRLASFYKVGTDRRGEPITIDVHPPDWLINAIADHRYWPGVRNLLTITGCPFIRADGTIARPGFDPSTATLYRPAFDVPELPEGPTAADAARAVEVLYEVICQFPFEDMFSFAVWVANLLTCIQRPVIAGPVPGFAYNGNAAGCGKGLLIDLHGLLVWGSDVATRSYPADPAEAAKVKLALALAAVPCVHFDNLTEGGSYGGGVIDSALTSTITSDRILGQSRDSGPVPLRPIWMLSGNNVSPIKDADRRWLPCNLVTTLEKPYERDDIQEKNLRAYVLSHRGELMQAALTILKAHALAGRPTGAWPTLGSYEEWDQIVRGAVWYAMKMDCLETQRRGASEKPDRLDKAALLKGWKEIDPDGEGRTVEEAIGLADDPVRYPILRAALLNISRDNKLPPASKVQYKLRSIKNTPINRMRFETCGENRIGTKLWRVVDC